MKLYGTISTIFNEKETMDLKATSTSIIAVVLMVISAVAQGDNASHRAKLDEEGTIELLELGRVLDPEVTFLPERPSIDGRLDEQLSSLPVRQFSLLWKNNQDNPVPPVSYRLAYGTDFLYVYIEAEGKGLTYRDRAFQNGDGFSLVIAKPRPDDEPTEEYYVLSCSAVSKPDLEWTRHIFWYYNVDNVFLATSENTRLEFREGDGVISFELLLPWSDVHPYHPWISDAIGFNLQFVKAIGDTGVNRYKAFHGTIGRENSPRWYGYLKFQSPTEVTQAQTFVSTDRRNVEEGKPVNAIAVTAGSQGLTEVVTAEVRAEDGDTSSSTSLDYECISGVTRREFEVIHTDLPPGDYACSWSSKKNSGEMKISVLPRFRPEEFERRLASVKKNISLGSLTTLAYGIETLEHLLADHLPYETASDERLEISRVENQLSEAERGNDPYAHVTGALKRAFRSKQDSTLQPYMVLVPEGYNPSKIYPLVVFLHGSATTEMGIVGHSYVSEGEYIALGPFGRGSSNGFATDEAQTDIAEAIDDVTSNYPIDSNSIVLTGFSMGGYGVYRTHWETPDRFKALAVFCGGTSYGRESLDFLTEDLERFRGMPIFIYHGEQDRNVSYDRALEMVDRLKAIGALVKFHSDAERGHQRPSDSVITAYHQWLRGVIQK
ncbi:MAG: alpha/beta hydrolase-fold protein [candidate division Zixibacteria bacterium]|nr:alpha/beta hydrolase-fold protein [candidate division Zixibacteria bacterium]